MDFGLPLFFSYIRFKKEENKIVFKKVISKG